MDESSASRSGKGPPLTLAEWMTVPAAKWVDADAAFRWNRTGIEVARSRWKGRMPWRLSSVTEDRLFEELALGCCNWNGRTRQAAVKELARRTHGMELPFLLLRLNDWAWQVRTQAANALKDRLHAGYAGHWVRWVPLADRVTQGLREDHAWLMPELQALLGSPQCLDELWDGLKSEVRFTRMWCLNVALERGGAVAQAACELAMHDREPSIRFQALRRRMMAATPAEVQIWHAKWGRDSFMPIRRLLLQALQPLDEAAWGKGCAQRFSTAMPRCVRWRAITSKRKSMRQRPTARP